MDRSAVERRLHAAGLDDARVAALGTLLWNVHSTGEVREVDVAHLSDAGFRHLDVCVICELLIAALSRDGHAPDAPLPALLAALDRRAGE